MQDVQYLMAKNGPRPVAPYSHAVRAGDFLFITGQMPTLPDDPTKLVEGGIEAQTHRVMENLKLVLEGVDSSLDRAVFARVYMVNFQEYDKMNAVYKSYFQPDRLPGRTCIGVTGLAVGALVEIDLIAT
ncbi:MAG: RidA family protein [Methyloligellaceae bacterium]